MPVLAPLTAGLLTGLSLIIAIGSQNAYVLRQGLTRQHVVPVVVVCAVGDIALITIGVAGLGALITAHPAAVTVARWAGAAFLLGYGVLSLLRARRPVALRAERAAVRSRRAAVLTALAFTFLNPHVYLDTVLLLGSVANQYGDAGRWWFAGGACVGSVLWFSGLGFAAGRLAPLLATPRAWQVLDVLIGVVMIGLGGALALG